MHLHTIAFKNVLRRKSRSLLTILGIAVAVCTMVAFLGVVSGFERDAFDAFQKRGADIVVVAEGVPNQLTSNLDENLESRIASINGVQKVNGALIDFISLRGPDSWLYAFVFGWKGDNPAMDDIKILEGRKFEASEKDVVLIGINLAKALNKKAGDFITLKHKQFKIIGIFRSFSVYENDSVVIPLREIQELLGRKNSVTAFGITLQDTATSEEISEKIHALKDTAGKSHGLLALPTAEYISESAHIKITHAMALVTSLIALIIGTIASANTMAMSVLERTSEIGILRAIGWKKWRIVLLILEEAVIISCIGGILGVFFAQILCQWISLVPQLSGLIEGTIPPLVSFEGFIVSLCMGIIGGLYPALHAARLTPREAIYHE